MTSQSELHQLEMMRTIFGVISRRDLSIDQQIEEILKAGCHLFDEDIGILSRIEGNVYTVDYVYAPGTDIRKGQKFVLADTFCSITLDANQPVTIEDLNASPYRTHPCSRLGINSYIGTPLVVDGSRFGTLNFSSTSAKTKPFLVDDLKFLATLADWAGNALGYNRLVSKLSNQASQDSLTGLYNRLTIIDKINRCLERHERDPGYIFAVLFVDLDGFKRVNDKLGHQLGDKLLKQVSGRMNDVIRPRDSLGRYGGDEFLVLLEDVTSQQAELTAKRFEDVLSLPFTVEGTEIRIGASVGVAFSDHEANAQALIDRADKLMYQNKQAK